MQRKKLSMMMLCGGILAIVLTGLALVSTQPVRACSAQGPSAQCGSQASSCKNCHETQARKPVNKDGTGWHQSHAFGDFCAICHGGNQQTVDETAAHTGMVAPLSDIKAACQQCHPNDLQARAQVYAKALNVKLDSVAAATPTTAAAAATNTGAATPQASAPQQAGLVPNDGSLVDYVQRYNEKALGQGPVNWGDIIMLVLILGMLAGGGALVLHNEKLVVVSFKDTRPVEGNYPADVVEMVPQLSQLKPTARKALRRLLGKPEAASELLASLDKLTQNDESTTKPQGHED